MTRVALVSIDSYGSTRAILALNNFFNMKLGLPLGRGVCYIKQNSGGDAMNDLSKTLIFFGLVLVGMGLFSAYFDKVSGLGKLPGDIFLRRGTFTFYFPLTTCVLLSLILTLVFTLFGKK